MINTKMGVFLLVGFIAGSFVASPELRAYAANTVFSIDIKDGEVKTPDLANNSVTTAKIKDGEIKTDDIAPSAIGSLRIKDNDVKAQDIATDAVGAEELKGVTKLTFTGCSFTYPGSIPSTGIVGSNCPVTGMAPGDKVSVTKENGNACFGVVNAYSQTGGAVVNVVNSCSSAQVPGTLTFSVIAYVPG